MKCILAHLQPMLLGTSSAACSDLPRGYAFDGAFLTAKPKRVQRPAPGSSHSELGGRRACGEEQRMGLGRC